MVFWGQTHLSKQNNEGVAHGRSNAFVTILLTLLYYILRNLLFLTNRYRYIHSFCMHWVEFMKYFEQIRFSGAGICFTLFHAHTCEWTILIAIFLAYLDRQLSNSSYIRDEKKIFACAKCLLPSSFCVWVILCFSDSLVCLSWYIPRYQWQHGLMLITLTNKLLNVRFI